MTDLDCLTATEIAKRLKAQPAATYDVPPELRTEQSREAAVLIPLMRVGAAWHVLYIRRALFHGDRHSGQVAFAGGKREIEDENLVSTALREAQEEVGLAPEDVTLLGRLNHHHTISEFEVTPYVAQMSWPYPLVLDQVEVARAFTIPLNWLANKSNYRLEKRRHPESNRPWPVVYYDDYDGEVLWGATARITLSMIEVLGRK